MWRRDRWLDLVSLVVITAVVLGFFWPVLVLGHWLPQGGGDLVSFLWPMARFTARTIQSGVIPLWNPHLYSGAPFAADNQSGVFYPLNLATYLIVGEPSYGWMEWLVILHVWIAAVNAFALARGLGLRRASACLAALSFSLSDLFITHIGNLNINMTAAWLPLLVLCVHRALTLRSVRWAVGGGAVLAVAGLAGHAQMLLFLLMAMLLYVLHRLVVDRNEGMRYAAGSFLLAGLTLLIGLGGAAVALIPAYEMVGHTGRGYLSYEEATRYSLPPRALLGLLAPDYFGRGPAGFWGPWERVEVGYAGVATLALSFLALGQRWRRRTGQIEGGTACQHADDGWAYFALIVPVGFTLAMGRHTSLYGLLYRFVPAFDQIRVPARLILLANLGLAMLAAYGLDGLLGERSTRWTRHAGAIVVLGAVITLVVGVLRAQTVPQDRMVQATRSIVTAAVLLGTVGVLLWGSAGHPRLAWLIVPVLAVDLIGLGSRLEVDAHDPTQGFEHDNVVAFLREDASLHRIESNAGAWQPNAALVHGLYDIGGIYNPLALAPYEAYRWAVGERGAPLYNLLGVKYVLCDKESPPGDERFALAFSEDPEIDVYLNTAALPRALLVYANQVVADHSAAWEAIHWPGFDPSEQIIVEAGDLIANNPGEGERRIAFVSYDINQVEISVVTPVTGYLFLSDVYYPGWWATVDGSRVEVLRANYAFRAVLVPPGTHRVRMVFQPTSWYVGLAISLTTWLMLLGAIAVWWARPRGERAYHDAPTLSGGRNRPDTV
ncbi:MAG: YfhO family protein [Chloroflexi bacterium]|nr:YfhO family protein [Chloroflexota bacterium]